MALPVEVVAGAFAVFPAEEVIEAHFPCVGSRGIRGDVPADAFEILVRPGDHHHRIPTDDAVKAFFHRQVAGVCALIVGVNGVEVGRFDHFDVHAGIFGRFYGGVKQTACFTLAPLLGDRLDGVPPFLGRDGVRVGLSRPSSEPHDVPPVGEGSMVRVFNPSPRPSRILTPEHLPASVQGTVHRSPHGFVEQAIRTDFPSRWICPLRLWYRR